MKRYMQVSDRVFEALVIKELKHEARLSDRQVKRVEWSHISSDGMLKTRRDREVKLSDELFNAIASLPSERRQVFSGKMFHSASLLEMPKGPERVDSTPVITDEKEILARLIAEKLLK